MIVTVSKGQQITIPSRYRKDLNLRIGSKVELVKRRSEIIIKPIGEDLGKLFEQAKKLKPKYRLTARQMDELVENEILGQ
ncbi:AbrB/MazE/SpoVT family DNA-binding domain-containing protein [Candidatus Woesearchaeota archaeon]|nr:AbrB/MazE/SpoVT family DNA-binding domain-containing protein [Candidatus Woesearchaeota archaeon]MBI2550179.1 AbrB/MazE/SpoVT family DNA-binding domain-containing protein [Candidatus Woesearchaeota archaeon]